MSEVPLYRVLTLLESDNDRVLLNQMEVPEDAGCTAS